MKSVAIVSLLGLQAHFVCACQRDRLEPRVSHRHAGLAKRQATQFPPILDQNEAILAGSFASASMETWSYYYTHGLHVAGTNQSMAQWTADRFSDFGWTAGLTSYCVCSGPSYLNNF